MKHILLTTIAAVLVVGCGPSVDIWTAAAKGNIEAVKQHLDAGTDLNAKDDGWTALHAAARNGYKEIAELLIDNGADVNVTISFFGTPLDRAKGEPWDSAKTQAAKKEIADLLRKHGGKTGEELKAEEK